MPEIDTGSGSSQPQGQDGIGTLLAPLGLLVVTFLVMVAFQTTQLQRERENLAVLKANQEAPLAQITRLRQQLDSIARSTAVLAAAGNKNAKTIVDELRKRGITINPNFPGASN